MFQKALLLDTNYTQHIWLCYQCSRLSMVTWVCLYAHKILNELTVMKLEFGFYTVMSVSVITFEVKWLTKLGMGHHTLLRRIEA
jgi:hypothetical protein